jgi:hypothetical protein
MNDLSRSPQPCIARIPRLLLDRRGRLLFRRPYGPGHGVEMLHRYRFFELRRGRLGPGGRSIHLEQPLQRARLFQSLTMHFIHPCVAHSAGWRHLFPSFLQLILIIYRLIMLLNIIAISTNISAYVSLFAVALNRQSLDSWFFSARKPNILGINH